MSEAAVECATNKFCVRNFKAALGWGLAGAAGIVIAALQFQGFQGLAGGVRALFALQAMFAFFRGVTLKAEGVAIPSAFLPIAPLVVFGRVKVAYPLILRLTSAGTRLGFEVVLFSTAEGATPVLFGSRAKKLALFDAMKARQPDIRIYRAV